MRPLQLISSAVRFVLQKMKVRLLFNAWQLGLYAAPDRRVLENAILPAIAADPTRARVLFVGVQPYTQDYPAIFCDRSFATIDPDPGVAAMGARRHVVDGVENLLRHFAPGSFDAVVMNGVIGWGLNEASQIDRALHVLAEALDHHGLLVLGVNEKKAGYIDPRSMPSMVAFAPLEFPALGTAVLVVPTPFAERTHTFQFFEKIERADQVRAGGAGDSRERGDRADRNEGATDAKTSR